MPDIVAKKNKWVWSFDRQWFEAHDVCVMFRVIIFPNGVMLCSAHLLL